MFSLSGKSKNQIPCFPCAVATLTVQGMPGLGGVSALGGCLLPGDGIPASTEADAPLWTEFLTHAIENITLPQTSFAGGNKAKKYLIECKPNLRLLL